ncbi:MAG: rod shape-determining protein [Christensenellales bacterium]
MGKIQLVVELGSSNTYIYKVGSGLVLAEPSLVANKYGTKDVFAVGIDAKKLIGKTSTAISVVSPIKNGIVANKSMAQKMFLEFYKKVVPDKSIFSTVEVTLCVSNGLTDNQLEDFKEVIYFSGVGNVKILPSCLTSIVGAGINVNKPSAFISLNIGGGTTDLAVVSLNEIVTGFSINFGGEDMDECIRQYIYNARALEISLLTAEKLKNECVSLYENDMSNMEVSGIDVSTKKPRTEIIASGEIRFAILHFFDNICFALEHLINLCSPEIANDIAPNGIVLTGGVAKLVGVEDYLTKKLAIPCFVPEDPEISTVLGGAKLNY